jgi:hypothetical protein
LNFLTQAFLANGVSVNLTDGNGKSVRDCARSGWIRDLLRDGVKD